MTCAVAGCPGPAERAFRTFLVCALHFDSGVLVAENDDLGRPVLRVDLGRIRFSESSRQGRLIRAMLAGVTAGQG